MNTNKITNILDPEVPADTDGPEESDELPIERMVPGEEGEDNSVSLAAMEQALLPTVLENLDNIAATYGKMQKVQEQRLAILHKGEKVNSAIDQPGSF